MWKSYILVLSSVALVTGMMTGGTSQQEGGTLQQEGGTLQQEGGTLQQEGGTLQQEGDSPRQAATPTFMSTVRYLLPLPSFRSSTPASPSLELDTIDLAKFYGYGAERHTVTTSDGYILEVHRIYNGSPFSKGSSKPVVLVHHAFLLNSREFLTLGPGKALGYMLADSGYDVWLCNARGNSYSRKHTSIPPDSKEFWDFSYTEYGMYDIPAVIEEALKVTGRKRVHYIGHSVGTISFLIMGSKRPDMLSKVQSYTALAPLTTATNGQSKVLRIIMYNYRIIAAAFETLGVYELLPHRKWLKMAGNTVCNNGWYTQAICTAFLFALCGDNQHFERTLLREMLTHSPSGSSIKTFRHFGQNYFNGFREYDYGNSGNLDKYNSPRPPVFNYSKINVPSQLYYGFNDLMANHKDAVKICETLPNVYRCEAVPDEKFSHLDFIWAKNAPIILYQRVLNGLERFRDE